jgi:hypothetical protein
MILGPAGPAWQAVLQQLLQCLGLVEALWLYAVQDQLLSSDDCCISAPQRSVAVGKPCTGCLLPAAALNAIKVSTD